MKKLIKRLWKKTAALLTAGAIALTLAAPAPVLSTAAADGVGLATQVVLSAVQRNAIRKEVNELNTTPEGQQIILKQFKEKYGVNNDYEFNQRLNIIMEQLSRAVETVDPSIKDLPYVSFITKETHINAACSLGHVMMVNAGTFMNITNDAEIAAIVGHEMGHGQKDHVKKGILNGIDRQIALGIGVAAIGGGSLSNLAATIVDIQLDAQYTKKHEWEADNMAFEYLKNTNYNLGAGAAVMQKFVELMGDRKQSGLEKFFNPADHPNSEARRDNYIKKLAEYSGGHINLKDGTITVNKKLFVTPTWSDDMSGAERACFVLGNLAAAYHNGHAKSEAYASGNTIYLGAQPIMTVVSGDEPIQVLVDRLNANK